MQLGGSVATPAVWLRSHLVVIDSVSATPLVRLTFSHTTPRSVSHAVPTDPLRTPLLNRVEA